MAARLRKQVQPSLGPEKAFGQALREFRNSREVSQELLAAEAGLDRTYISLLERGVRSPTVRILLQLATALSVSAAEIVARTEELVKPKGKR